MDQNFIADKTQQNQKQPKIIKRYGNRKLYDTEQSSYVVLKDIAKMIRNNEEVRVIDNETKDHITNSTFTQIIFGAEKNATCSAPLEILKNIIMKGDGSLSNFLAEMGLFKASSNVRLEKTRNYSSNKEKEKVATTPTLEERLTSATSSSHDILEENELPQLPNANKNINNTTS